MGTYIALYKNFVSKIKKVTGWADDRVESGGYWMNNEWHTEQAGSKFQGVSPVDFFRIAYSHEMLPWVRLRGITAHSVSLSALVS